MKWVRVLSLLTVVAIGAGVGAAEASGDSPVKDTSGRATRQAETYTKVTGHVVLAPGQRASSEVTCPDGQVPTGGGYNALDGGNSVAMVTANGPTSAGWIVAARNTSSTITVDLFSYAICAPGIQVP
ncbi:hypothetical protein AB0M29_25025 [Streptomyces sp. NPDC051976]|uniref:hypothetical protein n=1 Tax=Streptomyces sp. NPDC051976 TaxID=3154947 RepID=UPI00342BB527